VLAYPAELIGVGTVFGNCTGKQAAANAITVLAAAGRTDIAVTIGSPRTGPAPTTPSPHGADGLGDAGMSPPPASPQPMTVPSTRSCAQVNAPDPGIPELLEEQQLLVHVPRIRISQIGGRCPEVRRNRFEDRRGGGGLFATAQCVHRGRVKRNPEAVTAAATSADDASATSGRCQTRNSKDRRSDNEIAAG